MADRAEMAANIPITWAMMAGQRRPRCASRATSARVLQLARHVAVAAQGPVHQEDGAPRGDPHDHDVDEVLQIRREGRAEDGVHGDAERNDAVDEHGLVALDREADGLQGDARRVHVQAVDGEELHNGEDQEDHDEPGGDEALVGEGEEAAGPVPMLRRKVPTTAPRVMMRISGTAVPRKTQPTRPFLEVSGGQ